jgi:hypothetical protein
MKRLALVLGIAVLCAMGGAASEKPAAAKKTASPTNLLRVTVSGFVIVNRTAGAVSFSLPRVTNATDCRGKPIEDHDQPRVTFRRSDNDTQTLNLSPGDVTPRIVPAPTVSSLQDDGSFTTFILTRSELYGSNYVRPCDEKIDSCLTFTAGNLFINPDPYDHWVGHISHCANNHDCRGNVGTKISIDLPIQQNTTIWVAGQALQCGGPQCNLEFENTVVTHDPHKKGNHLDLYWWVHPDPRPQNCVQALDKGHVLSVVGPKCVPPAYWN